MSESKEDKTPNDEITGRHALDELSDSQRRKIQELNRNKQLGTGQLRADSLTRQSDEPDTPNRPSDVLARLGATYSTLGRPEQAIDFYNQALEGYRNTHDREGEAVTLTSLAGAFWQRKEAPSAVQAYEQALALYRVLGNRKGEATALNCIGLIHDQSGDQEAALGYYEQALAILWDVGDKAGEAATLDVIGMAQRRMGNLREALASHQQALEIRLDMEDRDGEASTRHAMALVFEETGQVERAVAYYEWALRLRVETGDLPGEAVTAYNLSKLYEKLSLLDEAEKLLGRAVDIEASISHPDLPKDEAELTKLRQKRRAAQGSSGGDTTQVHPRLSRDDIPQE